MNEKLEINIENISEASYFLWYKENKFYSAYLQKNLFGEFDLVKSWGSRITKRGSTKILYANQQSNLQKEIIALHKRRVSRGYSLAKVT